MKVATRALSRFAVSWLMAILAVLAGVAVVSQSGIDADAVVRAIALGVMLAFPALLDMFFTEARGPILSALLFVGAGFTLSSAVLYVTSPVEIILGTFGAVISAVPLSARLREFATSGPNVRAFALMHFVGLGLVPVVYGIGLSILYWEGSSAYQLNVLFWIRFLAIVAAFWRLGEPLFRLRWIEVYLRDRDLAAISRSEYLATRDHEDAHHGGMSYVSTASYLAYRDFVLAFPFAVTLLTYAGNMGWVFCTAMTFAYAAFALVFFNFPKLLSLRQVSFLGWSGSWGLLLVQVTRLAVVLLLLGGAVLDAALDGAWTLNAAGITSVVIWPVLGLVLGNIFALLKTLLDDSIIDYYRRRIQWTAASILLWWVGMLGIFLVLVGPNAASSAVLNPLIPFVVVEDVRTATTALTAATTVLAIATLVALAWLSASPRFKKVQP